MEDRVRDTRPTRPVGGEDRSLFWRLTKASLAGAVAASALSAALFGSASASNWTASAASGSHGEAQAGAAPAAPSGLVASCGSARGTIALAWSSVAHASSYVVLDSTTAASGPYSVLASGVTASPYQTSALSNNKTYWFEVEAEDGSNWVGSKSATSNSVKIGNNGNCTA